MRNLKKDDVKELPNIKQLCEDMGSEWKEVYAGLYMKYCREVHLNRNVTRKLAYENGEPKVVFYKDDIESEDVEFLTIASISSEINKAIRSFYDWHSDAMQNEYEQIKSRLEKKE